VTALAECDLVVSIGGDGTFLYAARHAGTTPVLGVNLGEVGFLNTVAPSDAVSAARREVAHYEETGTVRSESLPRVTARGDTWQLTPAINEVAVLGTQRGRGRALSVILRIDGERYVNRDVDGVLVATPAGSTAYNLSEGGPLLQPNSGTLVVTPMSPGPAARPLVVPQDVVVTVEATGQETAVVLGDGSQEQRLDLPAAVQIETAAEPARIAGPGVDLFGALGKLE
jgi:NAD+ kinase